MSSMWEQAFAKNQLIWGDAPTRSALLAGEWFAERCVRDVLIPGIGYGRNANPFLERGMSVTGIEVSETAIALARSRLGLTLPIHHGSVTDMPFDERCYTGVFCYGLLYLLDSQERQKLLQDCFRQLAPGGLMVFAVISKNAPMYGQGTKLGEDYFEILPGMKMFFYDEASARREFQPYGLETLHAIDEPIHEGSTFPFLLAICQRD
ncbi:class I SAM-dependent methyltransferase [Haliangium ochraceum]|uniref:Methyltransferase type 11 n=1 Tax=Haliangium ochraceum (strain DSM 14365 / JCM 11303 / SMP-2) TaxID=502025 RepID=D0LMM2_HALO1|nr:class I SAM-dependent methyltransferase [Haliangium ochraceum]ACY18709.1 Methyltransferase type 11 [Haliangium ochraceum DSM 14365]